MVQTPEPLLRYVPSTFLGAVQGIAALEVRIAEMRSWPGDFTPEIAAADAFLRAIRDTFGIPAMTEAEIDAAHEHAVAAFDRVRTLDELEADGGHITPAPLRAVFGLPDVPLALDTYWNHSS